MKVGLISDIHADLTSLLAALDLLQQQQVDLVVCAGDLVEKGTDGDAVVWLIRERQIPCVQGNHDFDAIGNQRWLRENATPNHPAVKGRFLNDKTLAYLAALPFALRFEWEGWRVLLTHGTLGVRVFI